MTIASYSDLQTAVDNWLNHIIFATRIPEFITLFEATANRRLRTRQMETVATITTVSGVGTLPTDYLSWRRLTLKTSPLIELEYVEPSYFKYAYPTKPTDFSRVFTIEGSSISVMPSNDTGLEMDYYAKIPALSDSNTSNWLLAAHPDVYLFGSLSEASMFDVNDERFPLWKGRRDEVFDEIQTLSNKTRSVGGIRVWGQTP